MERQSFLSVFFLLLSFLFFGRSTGFLLHRRLCCHYFLSPSLLFTPFPISTRFLGHFSRLFEYWISANLKCFWLNLSVNFVIYSRIFWARKWLIIDWGPSICFEDGFPQQNDSNENVCETFVESLLHTGPPSLGNDLLRKDRQFPICQHLKPIKIPGAFWRDYDWSSNSWCFHSFVHDILKGFYENRHNEPPWQRRRFRDGVVFVVPTDIWIIDFDVKSLTNKPFDDKEKRQEIQIQSQFDQQPQQTEHRTAMERISTEHRPPHLFNVTHNYNKLINYRFFIWMAFSVHFDVSNNSKVNEHFVNRTWNGESDEGDRLD